MQILAPRPREMGNEGLQRGVSPLELFYDIAYAFAVTQLSRHLLHNLGWVGAAETLVLLCAVFTAWVHTSFEATWLDITRRSTQAFMIAMMLLGLLMNASIDGSFTGRGLAFALPLVIIGVARTVLSFALAETPALRRHYAFVLGYAAASTPLWMVGAFANSQQRLWWWAAAVAIDVVGTVTTHWLPGRDLSVLKLEFDAEHMTERLRLFLVIALGEVILTTGTAMVEAPTTIATVVAGALAFLMVVSLWAIYFLGRREMVDDDLPDDLPEGRNQQWAVRKAANFQYTVLAGLIAAAVGAEITVAHPLDRGSWTTSLLVLGGALVYVAGQSLFHVRVGTTGLWRRWIACGILAAAIPLTVGRTNVLTLAVGGLVLAVLAITAPHYHYEDNDDEADEEPAADDTEDDCAPIEVTPG